MTRKTFRQMIGTTIGILFAFLSNFASSRIELHRSLVEILRVRLGRDG